MNKDYQSAGFLIENANRVLLYLRDDSLTIPSPNKWAVMGGIVEQDETPLQAVAREFFEELESIKTEELIKIHKSLTPFKVYEHLLKDGRHTQHVFKAETYLMVEDLKLNEGQAIRYFSKEDLRNRKFDLAESSKKVLNDYFMI